MLPPDGNDRRVAAQRLWTEGGSSLTDGGIASSAGVCKLSIAGLPSTCIRDEDCALQFISVADTGGQVLGTSKVRDGGKDEEADDRQTTIIFKGEKFSMSLPQRACTLELVCNE